MTGAILDPRFKTDWIASSPLNEEDVLDCVKSELVYRFRQMKDESTIVPDGHSPGSPLPNQNQTSNDSPTGQPASKRSKPSMPVRQLFSSLKRTPRPPSGASTSKVLEDFELYLSDPICLMEELIDEKNPEAGYRPLRPLKFWLKSRHRFPVLSFIARDVLGIAASSGSIERAFSTAMDIFGIKSINMKTDMLNQRMFIKRNKNFTV